MNKDLNVLILSCGTRNKVVQYFKKELVGKGYVYACDCSKLAPALYEADRYFIVPSMQDENYLDTLLSICKRNSIKTIFSLIDPELSFLAENRQSFLDIGTIPLVSSFEVVELCFNKYKMFEFMKLNGFKTVNSYIDKEKFYNDLDKGIISYPVFIKPVKGSASLNINKVSTNEEVEFLFNQYDDLMIQEYMNGIEYGIDVYIDMINKQPVAIFAKEKIKMRAGETDKSVSYKDEKLFELIKDFVRKVGLQGVIDIDVFKHNEEYYISEVNPRFGGGYPHAYECKVNMPKMIVHNIIGEVNEEQIGFYNHGEMLVKYNEVKIIKN